MMNWLAEQITRETHGKWDLRTPAGLEVAKRVCAQLQQKQFAKEPMVPEWSFPIEIEISGQGQPRLSVSPEWEKDNLLYLDFDSYPGSKQS